VETGIIILYSASEQGYLSVASRSSPLGFKNVGDFNVTWALKIIYGYKHILPGIFELKIMTFASYLKYLYT